MPLAVEQGTADDVFKNTEMYRCIGSRLHIGLLQND